MGEVLLSVHGLLHQQSQVAKSGSRFTLEADGTLKKRGYERRKVESVELGLGRKE